MYIINLFVYLHHKIYVMTIKQFKSLRIGDSVGTYKVTNIDAINGILSVCKKCEYLKCHYSLFLIYNKKLHKYE